MCADVDQYEELACEIRRLVESRFGELSPKEFKKVAKLLGFDLLPLKLGPTSTEYYYEKLSDKEREDIDFMMGL